MMKHPKKFEREQNHQKYKRIKSKWENYLQKNGLDKNIENYKEEAKKRKEARKLQM